MGERGEVEVMAPKARYRFLDDPGEAGEALRALAGERELAFDLEADSLHSYRGKVCLLQISSLSANVVVDVLACREILPALEELLTDGGIRKVLHGADYDVRLLKKDFGFGIRNIFDTMVAAQLAGRSKYGLAALLEEHFGVTLDKRHQQADWSARPLPPELLAYAAKDTAWLIPLRRIMEGELSRRGRLSWAEEEFRLLEEAEPAEERAPSVWDIKGAGLLSPEQRGYLQRLLDIRDGAARERDRPPFRILPNSVLISLVESPPSSRRDVVETRGASKSILARLAPALLDAFARPLLPGEIIPPRAREFTPLTARQRKILQALKKTRSRLEEKLGLPPGLLVNSATLEKLCRLEAGEAGVFLKEGLKNWQREVAGEELAGKLTAGPEDAQ